MKLIIDNLKYQDGVLAFSVPAAADGEALQLLEKIKSGRVLDVVVKLHNQARSLNANALLWKLLGDMAKVLGSTADEVYLQMLERYGVSDFMAVLPAAVPRARATYRVVRECGPKVIGGQLFEVLQVWHGSSGYDSAEFSRLLDGVISEAAEMDIHTISPADRDLLVREWGARDVA